MGDTHQKKEVNNGSGVNPVVAGIAGAVVGGMAVAAAVVMSDKKNQKKVTDAFVGAKEKVTEKLDEVVHDTKKKIEEKM